jgi:SAM-dependent methyltransferase
VSDLDLRRLSFNDHAATYRLARPPYPRQVYDLLASECGLGEGSRVLEIGAGTGQATRGLLARGAHVVAVEPGAELGAHLLADLGGPRLRVVRGDVETVELGEHDLVVAATSMHWVRLPECLPRLAAALRRDGWLAVWWTVFGDPENVTDFRWALDKIYERRMPNERHDLTVPQGPLVAESWIPELEQGGWFTVERVHFIRWSYELTVTRARGLFGTFSNVIALAEPDREALLGEIGDLVDAFGGLVSDPYVTVLYLARPADRTAPTTASAPRAPSVIV